MSDSMYEMLAFDLDGTLIDRNAAVLAACTELLGETISEDLDSLVENSRSVLILASHLRLQPDELTRHMLRYVQPDERLIELLSGLRRTHRLVLISNGSDELQRAKLERARLQDCFDRVLISGAVGMRKPEPRIFRMALEGVAPAQALMVGDDIKADVGLAHSVGAAACWVSRGRTFPHRLEAPKYTIDRVADLPEVLTCQHMT